MEIPKVFIIAWKLPYHYSLINAFSVTDYLWLLQKQKLDVVFLLLFSQTIALEVVIISYKLLALGIALCCINHSPGASLTSFSLVNLSKLYIKQ